MRVQIANDTRINKLFKLGKPAFYITPVSASQFRNLYRHLRRRKKEAAIRIIRGKKSKTRFDFYNEIAAALQFPYYFGENGAALNDCINDLEWLQADAYLLMVDDAHLFLRDASAYTVEDFMDIFSDANIEWLTPNKYFPRTRQPTPFHLLFRCDESDIPAFLQRLGDFANEVEVILFSNYIDEVVRQAEEEVMNKIQREREASASS